MNKYTRDLLEMLINTKNNKDEVTKTAGEVVVKGNRKLLEVTHPNNRRLKKFNRGLTIMLWAYRDITKRLVAVRLNGTLLSPLYELEYGLKDVLVFQSVEHRNSFRSFKINRRSAAHTPMGFIFTSTTDTRRSSVTEISTTVRIPEVMLKSMGGQACVTRMLVDIFNNNPDNITTGTIRAPKIHVTVVKR